MATVLPVMTVYEDDVTRELNVTWTDKDSNAIDVSAYTELKLLIERPPPSTVLEKTHTAVDLANGQWKYTFAAGDFVEGCGQDTNIRVKNAGGDPLVIARLRLDVLRRVTP